MTLYTDPRLSALGIIHGTTSRNLGNMRQSENVQSLWASRHIPESRVLRFKQIHSATLLTVTNDITAQNIAVAPLQEADGWVLTTAGWGAAIITADCVPLFIWDETARVIGLSHCGWRGVAAQLPAKTALQLRQAGAQGKLAAWVGPHIQGCCFEVQEDVAVQFPQACIEKQGRTWVDLNQAILQQLTEAGLAQNDIVFSPHCTCCEREDFFSFRRDHTRDAMLSFVYRPADPCI